MDKDELEKFYQSKEYQIWLELCTHKEYYNKEVIFQPLDYNEINANNQKS